MRQFEFETVDVFTNVRFGGNPLAVFPRAEGMTDAEMQALAAEMNLSETTFVLAAGDPANTARVRIFNRTAEMSFAGHPMVGTAYVLAQRSPRLVHLKFEVPAGLVEVSLNRDARGTITGATIAAPQPLSTHGSVPVPVVARCLSIAESDILMGTHEPLIASVGNPYVIAQVLPEALGRCSPNVEAFGRAAAEHPEQKGRFSVHAYARSGSDLRARMFAPLAGTWEDPATGSANAPLGALLLQREGGSRTGYRVLQGVEMGRPSVLTVEAERKGASIFATVGGGCVPVLTGSVVLDDLKER